MILSSRIGNIYHTQGQGTVFTVAHGCCFKDEKTFLGQVRGVFPSYTALQGKQQHLGRTWLRSWVSLDTSEALRREESPTEVAVGTSQLWLLSDPLFLICLLQVPCWPSSSPVFLAGIFPAPCCPCGKVRHCWWQGACLLIFGRGCALAP